MPRQVRSRFIVAAPSGVRIRTRLHPAADEAAALRAIGTFLGTVYRTELATRVAAGKLDHTQQAEHRKVAKKRVTAVTSSRWAGAITRTVIDQYRLGMRTLTAHADHLDAAGRTLAARLAIPLGERNGKDRSYRDHAEQFSKSRRLVAVRHEAERVHYALQAGIPTIAVGGKRLWRKRNNLQDAGITEQQWRWQWDASRMFFTADGESGKRWGNETITVTAAGDVRIKVPAALTEQFGTHLHLSVPVRFTHRGRQWRDRVSAAQAVRYDVAYDPDRRRWYLDVSWGITVGEPPPLDEATRSRVLGVDVNNEHLDAMVIDRHGNPLGAGITLPVIWKGVPASTGDGHLRAALTALLDFAQEHHCTAIAIENLDFADARATGRERMGRGGRGKRFRHTVAAIPTAKFRDRLTAMAATRGIPVVAVNPRNTSKAAKKYWLPQQTQTSESATVHQCAGITIGRRAQGHKLSRRVTGPRRTQRSAVGQPETFGDTSTLASTSSTNLPPEPFLRGDGIPTARAGDVGDQDRSGHRSEQHSLVLSE